MTSSNGTYSVLLALCEGNSPVTGGFPSQRPVTWSFEVFFDLRLNKRLSKQWRRRWFERPPQSPLHHCNGRNDHVPDSSLGFTLCLHMLQYNIKVLNWFKYLPITLNLTKPCNFDKDIPMTKTSLMFFIFSHKNVMETYIPGNNDKWFLTHWGPVIPLAIVVLDEHNGMLAYGTKPVSEPMMAYHQWHLWNLPKDNFKGFKCVWIFQIFITTVTSLGGQWLKT